ncbi:thrombospondin [Francisella tularensis]|uniref:thrombospondin n=1 Tax=Francisella tularensis TaxID=263 RepID=UPI002D7EDC1E|nr:thrombospondin [Francisella tularensis]
MSINDDNKQDNTLENVQGSAGLAADLLDIASKSKNEPLMAASFLVKMLNEPSKVYSFFKGIENESNGEISNKSVQVAVGLAGGIATTQAIKNSTNFKLLTLTKFTAITSFTTAFLGQAVESYIDSDGSLESFSLKYSEDVKNIKIDTLSDFGWGVLSGDTFLKGAYNIANTDLADDVGDVVFGFFDKLNSLGASLGSGLYDLTHDEIALNSSQSGNQETLRVIRRDPLTLDLDGDGIETVSADGSVLFDSNADGIKRGTGWVGADDGLLVRDIDGSGTIDNGQ